MSHAEDKAIAKRDLGRQQIVCDKCYQHKLLYLFGFDGQYCKECIEKGLK